ncbi:acyl-CoA dehydrogenase family protein [Pseudonocardia sp. MCCB 268]|nr:acyl-CoA dehydrogenase family protein [Pseudonocardia cytotoxica]
MDTLVETVLPRDCAISGDQVRDSSGTRSSPRAGDRRERRGIPADIREQAATMGLFGYAPPEEYGGLGLATAPRRGAGDGVRPLPRCRSGQPFDQQTASPGRCWPVGTEEQSASAGWSRWLRAG